MLSSSGFLEAPNDSERFTTPAGNNERTFFQSFHRAAIRGRWAYYFIIFQPAQDRIPAERIRLQLIALVYVPQQVLFGLTELRRNMRFDSF